MAFLVFRPQGGRNSVSKLTISEKSGRVFLNAGSVDLLKESGSGHDVVVLWDPTSRVLAVRWVKKGELSSGRLSFHKQHKSAAFSSKELLSFIGWDVRETKTIPVTWNAAEKQLEATVPVECLGVGVGGTSKSKPRT